MGPALLKIIKTVSVVGLIFFGLWALSQFGVLDTRKLFVQTMSYVPGLSDLAKNYELGQKRSALFVERDTELTAREKKLKADEEKLAQAQTQLDNEKFRWDKQHPTGSSKPATTPGPNYIYPVNAFISQPRPSDAKVKEYLAMVGKMKPSQAAVVIQKLPEQTVFMIFDQLRPSQVTRILEKLPEDYLAKLTQDRLNKYRNL